MLTTSSEFSNEVQNRARSQVAETYEIETLSLLIDKFADEIKKKIISKIREKSERGWEDPSWPHQDLIEAIQKQITDEDPVDVAAFAAFWWNRQQKKEDKSE